MRCWIGGWLKGFAADLCGMPRVTAIFTLPSSA
jgi:hypothetical protein